MIHIDTNVFMPSYHSPKISLDPVTFPIHRLILWSRYYTSRKYTSSPDGVSKQATNVSTCVEPEGYCGRQLEWLRGRLALSNARWKVVVGHHSPFTSGDHRGDDQGCARPPDPFAQLRITVSLHRLRRACYAPAQEPGEVRQADPGRVRSRRVL